MKFKKIVKFFLPRSIMDFYHFCWPLVGAIVFGFPGKDKNIKIIGVTGTSGKSTTTDLITRILEDDPKGAPNRVASISTIRFKIADKEWENKYKMSMPGRFVIQRFLSQAKKAECKYVVLEVTSEGIRQFRHKFINFDTAVFTNLTPEHIESHGGFDNYKNEKLKLFKITKNIHVINIDDENSKSFLDIPANKKVGFSMNDIKNIKTGNELSFEFENQKFNLNLSGEFNIYNALAAISTVKNYGVGLDVCAKALEKAKGISGRMEIISDNPIKVIVDYAHTPAQLEAVYKTFSAQGGSASGGKESNLVCVLGSCGGGRDKWKRPILGQLAEKYCKEIIITNEDPYDEDPLSIIKEIESALSNDGANLKHQIILDRREAINTALKLAKQGDVVIITGKGSEPWMCLENGKKIPWDDRQIAREAINKKIINF